MICHLKDWPFTQVLNGSTKTRTFDWATEVDVQKRFRSKKDFVGLILKLVAKSSNH